MNHLKTILCASLPLILLSQISFAEKPTATPTPVKSKAPKKERHERQNVDEEEAAGGFEPGRRYKMGGEELEVDPD